MEGDFMNKEQLIYVLKHTDEYDCGGGTTEVGYVDSNYLLVSDKENILYTRYSSNAEQLVKLVHSNFNNNITDFEPLISKEAKCLDVFVDDGGDIDLLIICAILDNEWPDYV